LNLSVKSSQVATGFFFQIYFIGTLQNKFAIYWSFNTFHTKRFVAGLPTMIFSSVQNLRFI